MIDNQIVTHRDIDMETKIMEAATIVFIHKGLAGASMQDIADEARISRTSLHYYYRNKDKLFDAVFEHVFNSFVMHSVGIINSDMPLYEKLKCFTSGYMDFLLENPGYISFLVHDLNATPERMVKLVLSKNLNIEKLKGQIIAEMKNNRNGDFDVAQFWASLIGMCIMPFVFKPMVTKFFLDDSEENFCEFINNRKQHILDFLMKYIKN